MRTAFPALAAVLLLAGCNNGGGTPPGNAEMQRALDAIAQSTKDTAAQTRDLAAACAATQDSLKAMTARLDELNKVVAAAGEKQKRGALYLRLDVDAPCDNDAECTNTARAVCNRINYPNAITSKFNPGVRPSLSSLVCFD